MHGLNEGLLCIDKPKGYTSHDVVKSIRRVTNQRRVGHTGTLDPLATGLLLICVGRATRLSEYLLSQPKSYEADIRLGQETNTYDADGEIVAERPVALNELAISVALEKFRGTIKQVPPMFSALKIDGQPLYKKARQGVVVERAAREITVYQLDVLSWESPHLKLNIVCSSGTYIRSIAHDLGQELECGGHITGLRRTAVGQFSVENALKLDEVGKENWQSLLQPMDLAVSHLPTIRLTDEESMLLAYGQRVSWREGQTENSPVVVYDEGGRFIGIAVKEASGWQARKIFFQPDAPSQ